MNQWLAAMHAQAAQLRADGAENSGAGSPQISEAKEQDIAEQDNADMPTSHAQGDGHAGPLGQVAGSQAPLTVPLPAIQGEVAWPAKFACRSLVRSGGPC